MSKRVLKKCNFEFCGLKTYNQVINKNNEIKKIFENNNKGFRVCEKCAKFFKGEAINQNFIDEIRSSLEKKMDMGASILKKFKNHFYKNDLSIDESFSKPDGVFYSTLVEFDRIIENRSLDVKK